MTADDRGPQLEAVVIVLLVLCWVSVSLRCYTMGLLLRRFYAEDWLAIITLVLYTAYSAFSLLGVHYGLGAHIADVPLHQHPEALFYKWAGQVTYVIIAALVKFIVGLLLLRLCTGKKWQCITLWALLVMSGVYAAFYVFVVIFQCQPVQFYWYRYDTDRPVTGTCNGKAMATIPTYISFVVSVVLDWVLALLPISILWNAKMDRRSKISVACVLALGSIASMATIVRIPYAKQLLSDPDYLYNFTDLAIWSTVEIGLGLTASSLATLKPLFRRLKILMVTRSGSNVTDTLPHHYSRQARSRTRSGSLLAGAGRKTKKLQKSPPIRTPAMSGWEALDDKPSILAGAYELSLATETSSVRTTITASLSLDGGNRLSPPPPSYYHNSFKRTSVSFRISHVDLPEIDSGRIA